MSQLRSGLEELTLKQKKAKDYDPEDELHDSDEESVSGSEDVEDQVTPGGREHYEIVGKSRLRNPETAPLDAKYHAVAVSREALHESERDDDPFAYQDENLSDEDPFAEPPKDDADAEIDSDNVQDEAAESRSSDVTMESESDQSEQSAEEQKTPDEHDSEDNGEENDDDSDSAEHDSENGTQAESGGPVISQKRDDLRARLSKQTHSFASSLSHAASVDVKKGKAVKRQYQTFDRLLDARIKLQKGLVASTELSAQQEYTAFAADAEEALVQAQNAALTLFNTIGSFRDSINNGIGDGLESQKKRKRRPTLNDAGGIDSSWDWLVTLEKDAQISRRKIIDKWSNKVKASDPTRIAASSKSKLLESSQNDHITAVLDTYIINEHDKHFRDLKSEHESDSASSTLEYDDNVFYQSLLRDLITSRAATSTSNIPMSLLPHKLHPSGNKQNKKSIDTRASKGRKIRYTVHDKLQNFMAAEGDTGRDTAMWTERGKTEFFGSLFGQDRALVEDEDQDEVQSGEDQSDAEIEALRLFKT